METPQVFADRPPDVEEIHIVWMTSGLSCDGDTISMTAATLPSIEDVVLGAAPGLPKVHLHNPVLAYEVGDDPGKDLGLMRQPGHRFFYGIDEVVPMEKEANG